MDMITFAMLNGMKKSGGMGHIENRTITWDGDETGKVIQNMDGVNLALVSDTVFTADQVEGVSWTGAEETIHSDRNTENDLYRLNVFEREGVVMVFIGTIPVAICIMPEVAEMEGVQPGTYFITKENEINGYTSGLKLKTIHPIDPKFLPGVCLPVVELSTTIADGATLTDEENAALTAAFEGGVPFVLKCNVAASGITANGFAAVTAISTTDNTPMVFAKSIPLSVGLTKEDGAWVCGVIVGV